ncbi:hypothetical protein BJX99DRAFT_234443 [Aspergillus californicus]
MAKATPSRDRRFPPRNNPPNPSPAALQGALQAFHYASPSPPKIIKPAIIMADPPISLLDSDPDPPPELPEPGSIKDKIARFGATATAPAPIPNNRPRTALGVTPGFTREKSPQLLAAEIAARRSPAPSNPPGVDVHRFQSTRAVNPPSQGLPSPTPIRKTSVHHSLLDPSLDDSYGFPPANPPVQQRSASRNPSTSRRPPITKPRPIPPVPRKPSPISNEVIPTRNRLEPTRRYDEPPSGHLPLRSKDSVSTLSEPAPPLPPRRNATLPIKDTREHQYSPGRVRSPVWPSSSSVASLYSQSQNPSSSSMLDGLSDISREGPSDAIAASSLASIRALRARKSPPPPPPSRRRRSRSRSLLQMKKVRTPNPSPGGLRETLRTPAKSDDDDDDERRHRQHKNRIINKHPHKHQEGDRKRWRSEITEKERKKYEGVWAANKGLFIPPSQVMDGKDPEQETPPGMYPPTALRMVVNLVVQDIWSRSRLPNHVLERIWDLVDGQKIGLLTRAEFVVGMWLIDQQLKGHKLPTMVPDSVWASVLRVPGISLDDPQP